MQGMVWDRKLNSMQLTAGKLRRLINHYNERGDSGRCRLRTPHRSLT